MSLSGSTVTGILNGSLPERKSEIIRDLEKTPSAPRNDWDELEGLGIYGATDNNSFTYERREFLFNILGLSKNSLVRER